MKSEHNEVYETIKRGLEDALNCRVTEYAPIVRCKDCKWWKNAVGWGGVDLKKCELSESVRKPDWFCADGERKE